MATKKDAGRLAKFEGREVIGTQIAITNAGDGLSKAMSIEPEQLKLGETVYIVLEATVSKITMQEVKDTRSLLRVQTLKAGTATLVDEELVSEVLEEQRVKLEEAEGVVRLDFGDKPEEADDEATEGGEDDDGFH